MRITTSMLNETAKKTGIPVNQNSLLSYINNEEGSTGNALLDALNNRDSKVSSAANENYKKLGKIADSLAEYAEKLAAGGEESFYEKIKAGEDPKELYSTVESLVDAYNNTLKQLQKSSGALNDYYKQMLQENASQNKEALEKVGITINKDGTLSLDSDKLKSASVEDLEAVFGANSTFTTRTGFIAGRVSSNAQAGQQSISGQYSASGSLLSQLASKYDFWG